jgi:hydrogen peroxide-dependent heme synthase
MFRIRRDAIGKIPAQELLAIAAQAAETIADMERREDGQSAAFVELGHKGDLMLIHFRRNFDELAQAEAAIAKLSVREFLEQTNSYLSMVEIGLYEATVRLHRKLAAAGVAIDSDDGRKAVADALAENREKLGGRLWPRVPDRRYVCFYPMNKRRGEHRNWYQLPLEERQRLMHEHGMIGRRYAGQVTQIISGSVGFDDWEWGVDLFADDPLVFKKLVYEMRFDESSAFYAEFGKFEVAIRLTPDELARTIAGSAAE